MTQAQTNLKQFVQLLMSNDAAREEVFQWFKGGSLNASKLKSFLDKKNVECTIEECAVIVDAGEHFYDAFNGDHIKGY